MGWFWFLGTLVPVIGIVQVGDQAMADRYSYVPLIGLFLIAAWGGADLAEAWRIPRARIAGLCGIVLILLSWLTWNQIGHWKSSESLFRHTVNVTHGNAFAHALLGQAIVGGGHLDEGIEEFRRALEIDPDQSDALTSLAMVLMQRGELGEAAYLLNRAVELRPLDFEAHFHLGILLSQQSRMSEAVSHLLKSALYNSHDPKAYIALGIALESMGKLNAATAAYRGALRIDPGHDVARRRLGAARQLRETTHSKKKRR